MHHPMHVAVFGSKILSAMHREEPAVYVAGFGLSRWCPHLNMQESCMHVAAFAEF
jgi:hypothetical protein